MSPAQAASRAPAAAHHVDHRSQRRRAAPRGRAGEARLRRRHFARRRRDLLTDCLGGVVLALLVMAVSSGLGIVLLLLIPVVGGLIAAALVRRGLPQRVMAAWRTWAWARVDARMGAVAPSGRSRASARRPASPRPAPWEEIAAEPAARTRRARAH